MGLFTDIMNLMKGKPASTEPEKITADNVGISGTGSGVGALSTTDIKQKATFELRDILAPYAIKITPKSLIIGEKYTKTYFVVTYPRYLNAGWLSSVITLDAILDISIHIHPVETSEVLNQFRKKVAEVEARISEREEKGIVRDPQLDSAYRDLERLRDQLQQSEEKIFNVGLYITIYANSDEDLYKLETELRSLLEAQMIYIKPSLFEQDKGFHTTSPIADDQLLIDAKLNSGPVASMFPFISSELSDNKGIMYGVNRHTNGLILFDRYSLPNYNSVTFATSGAGKSFATKLEILRTMMFDTDVIVIDPEREYEYLAEAVGGRYFNISLSSEHHINPFDLPIPQSDEDPADILRSNIIALVGLFRVLLGGLSPEEDAIMDRAINETYSLRDITPQSDFSRIEPPLMSDLEMVMASMEGAESLLKRLTKYTQGTWAGFINKPSNVDINKKLVVFSIRDMEEELKPAAMYIITQYIWNQIRKNLKRRLLVVDEAWVMMKTEDTASFLYGIAKRGRKYFLGLSTITQDVGDFMSSKYGLAIVTNASMQLLLKQSPSTIDNLQKTFNLTDEEKYLLLEAGVGEGIFFAGRRHAAIRIISSATEEQIITSNPETLLARAKATEAALE
jgi:conjugal transfer ATP-binding protein TraC